jgi:Fur family peroxide stress response transcriptional regulator
MNKSAEVLKDKGIRVTPQRIGVYKLLKENPGHFTAEELYERIKKNFPGMSLATVYSILELLKEKGLVQEIRINFDKSCFESRACVHHHFLCQRCKKIYDIDIVPCPTLATKQVNGHLINKFQGYFYGICKDCREKDV